MAVTVRHFNMNSGLCNAAVFTGITLLLIVTPSRMGWFYTRAATNATCRNAVFGLTREYGSTQVKSRLLPVFTNAKPKTWRLSSTKNGGIFMIYLSTTKGGYKHDRISFEMTSLTGFYRFFWGGKRRRLRVNIPYIECVR